MVTLSADAQARLTKAGKEQHASDTDSGPPGVTSSLAAQTKQLWKRQACQA